MTLFPLPPSNTLMMCIPRRYVIIKKLGWGHFSTVWMVKDRTVVNNLKIAPANKDNPIFFALKVQKSAEHYTEAAMDEVELLDCVAQERKKCESILMTQGPMARDADGRRAIDNVDHSRHTAMLHDSFFHNGPHGRHMAMVFGMLGCNLLSVIKAYNYRGIPIPAVKRMIKGVCKGLDFLHRKCQIIHTDLKPENILLQFPDQISAPTILVEDPDGDEHAQDHEEQDAVAAGTPGAASRPPQEGMTIEELEAVLKNQKLSADERKRLKKRLKKKRQKERRKQAANNHGNSADTAHDTGGSDDDFDAQSTLSDMEMEAYFKKQMDNAPSAYEGNGAAPSARADANKFVSRNFCPAAGTDEQVAGIMNDTVVLTAAGRAEVEAHLGACGSLMRRQHRVEGVAEVTFLMRINGKGEGGGADKAGEAELAERVSQALDGIRWVKREEGGGTKVW